MSDHVLIMRSVSDAKSAPQRAAKSSSSARWKRPESWEYRLLYSVTFTAFLVAACIETLDPRRMVRKDAEGAQKTIIQKASLGARTCVAYAFMG